MSNQSKSVLKGSPHGFRLGFTSLENEVALDKLPVRGNIPVWLTGTLIRNGPAKFEVGNKGYRHWFDGLAMLHKFSFRDGSVSYANRFLHSRSYKQAMETGRISYGEFATDPCRSIFGRVQSMFSPRFTDNANVNVTRIGNKFIAMTETPIAVEFEPNTLEAVGVVEPRGSVPGQITTAHPHYDYARKEALNYVTRLSQRCSYNVYRIHSGGAGKGELMASLPTDGPSYMHSFGMTENFVVLTEFPLILQLRQMLMSGKPFIENFQWMPERGTRFVVVEKRTGKTVGSYRSAPFFAFHHVNAFEREDEIIVDVVAYDDASIIRSLYLDVLRGESPGEVSFGELRRYRVRTGSEEVTYDSPPDRRLIELPRINYRRFNTRDYRYAYAVGSAGSYAFASSLLKVDVTEGASREWSEEGCYTGEPVFVARPSASAEDDGVILSVVLDSNKGSSFLLVLDAESFEEKARAEVPHHIPFGFHGQYYEDPGVVGGKE